MTSIGLPVVCLTSDPYLWAVKPFSYLFSKYFPQPELIIAGFTKPTFPLYGNAHFFQISPTAYPANRWSDGLIEVLSAHTFDHFILMLEDYWLTRPVDVEAVRMLHEYVSLQPDILRMDLTSDRIVKWDNYPEGRIVDYYERLDIVQSPPATPYLISFQASIWNRKLLLPMLSRGKDSWFVELYTPIPANVRVMGTYQCPMRYANAVLKGAIMPYELDKLCTDDRTIIEPMLPKNWSAKVPEYK